MTVEYPMHVLSFDFQSNVTSRGLHIRFFNVIDEFTRTALAIIPRRSFTATDVVAVLEGLLLKPGSSRHPCGAITGLNSLPARWWIGATLLGVSTAFIDPGSPWQNGFIESFNAQFRREQLSGEIMDSIVEAKYLADEWKGFYNQERPHGSLNGLTPSRIWDE